MSPSVSIRGATEADLDRLIEIHTACYPDDRSAPARKLNFVQNAIARFEDLRVAERAGVIVGHGFGVGMGVHVGGALVPAVGIASVGVAPEARGSGVASAIVSALEEEARAAGASLAILHAFRHGFYARRGYADVTPNRRLACDPRAVPRAWVEASRASNLRAAVATDVELIVELHSRAAKRSTGFIERSEALWTRMLASERRYYVVVGDAGYVSFEIAQRETHAKSRLFVRELVATDDESKRLLWGFLGAQAGQVTEIEIEIAEDDPIAFALTDIDGARYGDEIVEHMLGGLVAGPMVKILDAKAALAARGYASSGEVSVVVSGEALCVSAREGRAAIATVKLDDALTVDARTLASIAFGGLRVRDAARLALASGSEKAIARADALFRIPPFFTVDRF